MSGHQLDSRTWLSWAVATMPPLLITRNPFLMVEILVIVLVVRAVWLPHAAQQGMSWFIRIAATMIVISVVFNVLTVHSGDHVIASLPASWPVVGGPLTWNALIYGLVGGLAMFTLVLTGITVSTLISWIALFRVLPSRLAPIAVTGSVAWAFLPQTAVAWRQIREAQIMRGHQFRRVRDFLPIVVPLLAGGLERSLAMAEALEARGFGASVGSPHQAPNRTVSILRSAGWIAALVGIAVGAYGMAVGRERVAAAAIAIGLVGLFAAFRSSANPGATRTRYRLPHWQREDSLVVVASGIALATTLAWSISRPETLAFSVYPTLEMPSVELGLMVAFTLLLVPAFVIPDHRRNNP